MNIVHIIPNAPYNDYWGYQDNLLPKYHKKVGNNVTVFASNKEQRNGQAVEVPCADYILNDGVRVVRKAFHRYPSKHLSSIAFKFDLYDDLCQLKPDYIFCHGLMSMTIFDVIKYKKKINKNCVVIQDNHHDKNIGFGTEGIKLKALRMYYRWLNSISIPYVDRVYGVTPWRKEYAEEYFGIPKSKTDILIMGADDEKIDFVHRDEIRKSIRDKYSIKDNDFLIVSGGKIDKKKRIDSLMRAVGNIEGVKLLVFGNVLDDVKDAFNLALSKADNITYIGWIDSDLVYNYFFAADLVFFPGQHSVLWEQACASKVPCVFERWEGMEHVNNGGNSDFVYPPTVENISDKIKELKFTDKYYKMKKIAESDATDIYLYSKIAEKSLNCKARKV